MALDELKNIIKEDTPISSIIGNYLPITRRGTTQLCVCPFHDDHKPSMNINDQRKMFMCFACNVGGDAISFVQKFKNFNYMESLEEIAAIIGLNYEEYLDKKEESPRMVMARRILSKVTQLYRKVATSGSAPAFSQFISDRGLSDQIASTYFLGFSPVHNAVTEYLFSIPAKADRELAISVAEEIGLIRQGKYGKRSHYDPFRERIMFPIWDQGGHVIGFTSRATKPDQKAKYMNSLDSLVFNKRTLLYGLHLAKSEIRNKDQVLLVEGNMDQIALTKAGFQHSVAIMGTAMGDSSLARLKNLTKNIYLTLDGDTAGWKAAVRVNIQCLKQGIQPHYVDLSPHKDPDDFLNAEGPLELQRRIDQSIPFIDQLMEQEYPEEVPERADKKLELLERFFEILAPLGASLSATERLGQAAKRLGLQSDPAQISASYHEYLEKNKENPVVKPQPAVAVVTQEAPPISEAPELSEAPKLLSKVEKTLIKELILHPECLTHPKGAELLDFVTSNEVKKYVSRLKDLVYEAEDCEFSNLIASTMNDDTYSLELKEVAGAAAYRYRPSVLDEKIIEKLLVDIKKKLQEDQLKTKREEILAKQKQSITTEESNLLLQELAKIDREIYSIKSNPSKGV